MRPDGRHHLRRCRFPLAGPRLRDRRAVARVAVQGRWPRTDRNRQPRRTRPAKPQQPGPEAPTAPVHQLRPALPADIPPADALRTLFRQRGRRQMTVGKSTMWRIWEGWPRRPVRPQRPTSKGGNFPRRTTSRIDTRRWRPSSRRLTRAAARRQASPGPRVAPARSRSYGRAPCVPGGLVHKNLVSLDKRRDFATLETRDI